MRVQLFLLQSLDGKISTGASNDFDFDKDLAADDFLSKGLQQYYDYEKTTAPVSIISGAIASKLGANEGKFPSQFVPVTFCVIDSNHLNRNGVESIKRNCQRVIFMSTNYDYYNLGCNEGNAELLYVKEYDLYALLNYIRNKYDVDWVTVQTGGTLNAEFVRKGLITEVDIFIAPTIVGGKNTPTLVDGTDLSFNEFKLTNLELVNCNVLDGGYIHVSYRVVNNKKSALSSLCRFS